MNLVVLQSAYPYEVLRERNLLDFATSKDLGGFFDRVYTVHPAATVEMDANDRRRYGKIATYHHSPGHHFIEAKVGRYWSLRRYSQLNFLLSQIGLIFHLLRLTWRDEPLIIRSEDPRYNGLLGYLLTRLKRLPFIVASWGNPDSIRKFTHEPLQPRVFRNAKIEESCEKFLLKRADCVLVQNEDNFKYAVFYGAKNENVKYFRLGNAIYPEHFSDPQSRSISLDELKLIDHDGFKVCTVSRLEKLKLVDHTIRSFHAMRRNSECHLYVFGDGSERELLAELAREMNIQERVHFLGNIDQKTLAALLPRMDLVLSPSMGRALTEVALASLAIVAYDTDCHPEIVKTDETGILVEYLDIEAMAVAGDFMFENRADAKRMGRAARQEALKLMDPDKLIKEQRAIFSDLLAKF